MILMVQGRPMEFTCASCGAGLIAECVGTGTDGGHRFAVRHCEKCPNSPTPAGKPAAPPKPSGGITPEEAKAEGEKGKDGIPF